MKNGYKNLGIHSRDKVSFLSGLLWTTI